MGLGVWVEGGRLIAAGGSYRERDNAAKQVRQSLYLGSAGTY